MDGHDDADKDDGSDNGDKYYNYGDNGDEYYNYGDNGDERGQKQYFQWKLSPKVCKGTG